MLLKIRDNMVMIMSMIQLFNNLFMNNHAEIFVINGDCLDAVMYFKDKYPQSNPVVLNMAKKKSWWWLEKWFVYSDIFYDIELFYLI